MRLDLLIPCEINAPPIRVELDASEDDIRSILDEICNALSRIGNVSFEVSGFGDENWPVDVRTDLPILLEQLPDAIYAVGAGREFIIDFYEQGIERQLTFSPASASSYTVVCASETNWYPEPSQVELSKAHICEMLFGIQMTFVKTVQKQWPRIAIHPWFADWAKM